MSQCVELKIRQLPAQFNNEFANPEDRTMTYAAWERQDLYIFKNEQENQKAGASQKVFLFCFVLLFGTGSRNR